VSEVFTSVGVVVCDRMRTRFLVQQKDATYPRFPLGYSFFGGALEPGESPGEGVERELREELLEPAASAVIASLREVAFEGTVEPGVDGVRPFHFTLFEAVLAPTELERLAALPVHEGLRGAVVDREELARLPFVWGLGAVVTSYLAHGGGGGG